MRWLMPDPEKAWPAGDHEAVLLAAVHRDPAVAAARLRDWLSRHDLDDVSYREQRLLLAAWARLGGQLRDLPEAPRLAGLQRMLWTRTMLLLKEAAPAFSALARQDIPVLLIKGATRLADARSRAARSCHDLDLVVPHDRLGASLAEFARLEWEPSNGASALRMAALAPGLRSVNLYHGRFGDIDLHGRIFHHGQGTIEADKAIWSRAGKAMFNGIECRAPSHEDAALIAIAHGSLDAHANSDWLVDLATLLRQPDFDHDRLASGIAETGISVPALAALSWLESRAGGVGLPVGFMEKIRSHSPGPLDAWAHMLQARPRDREGVIGRAARYLAKVRRKGRGQAGATRVDPAILRPPVRVTNTVPALGEVVRVAALPMPDEAGPCNYSISMRLAAPIVRRRHDFEINTDGRHVAAIRLRLPHDPSGKAIEVSFDINLDMPPGAGKLVLESRPLRGERLINEGNAARLAAPRFALVSASVRALEKAPGNS